MVKGVRCFRVADLKLESENLNLKHAPFLLIDHELNLRA